MEALTPADEASAGQTRRAPVTDLDESGGSQPGIVAGRWVRVNTTVVWCKGLTSRRHAAFEALSAPWTGIVVRDGDAVYPHEVHGRQPCLAQLIRRARGLAARQEPELAQVGSRVLTAWPRLGHWAHAPPTAPAAPTWYARLVQLLHQHRLRNDEAGTMARTRARELGPLWTFAHSTGFSGRQMASDSEDSSTLDFPLIHEARLQDQP